MYDVFQQAHKLVEPTKNEIDFVDRVARKAFALVKEHSTKFKGVVDVLFGGSYAKGTWLKGDVDIDIFVKVSQDLREQEFERIGKDLGKLALKKYKPYLRYSEHPYVEAFVDDIRVNVVPCYDVEKGKWKSAADRSPYHTQLVKQSFDDEKRREVRLLKKFMKTMGIYGAEIATNGFSGYVCEVLILKYGTCMKVLEASAEFKERQVISLESVEDNIIKLFDSSLIIIDPVDSRRNLGTAISDENVGKLILTSRRFIMKPSIKFFRGVPSRKELKFTDNIILVEFNYKDRSPDIIWGQLKSSAKTVAKQLSINGFNVIRYVTSTNEEGNAAFAFMIDSMQLPGKIVRQGPKVFDRKDSDKFIAKNLKKSQIIWIGDEARMYALLDNKFTDAVTFLKFLFSKNINSSGIAPGLIDDIRRGYRIYSGKKVKWVRENFVKEAIGELVTTDQFAFG
ncbi:MAG: CCA tRNA nucleotidyltransferase [Nitrososphaerales archaeon]